MKTETSLVSIIIVGLNHWPFLKETLSSIFLQKYKRIEVIYVDNGSNDGSVNNVIKDFPGVIIIANPENLGFCRGNNQGIRIARGEFILILNPDVVLADDCIEQLIRVYVTNKRAGLCAPKLIHLGERKKINSAGMRFDSYGRTHHIGDGELDRGQYSKDVSVPMLSGACLLIKRTVFEEIGLFDEDYFAYYEDGELSLRAWWLGWECICSPAAIAYHFRNAATKTSLAHSRLARFYENRNRYFLTLTFMPLNFLIKALPVILFRESLVVFRALGSLPRGREVPLEIRSRLAAVSLLPSLLKKRRRLNRRRRISNRLRDGLFRST